MSDDFSESIRFWLAKRHVLLHAEDTKLAKEKRAVFLSAQERFNRELADILASTRNSLERKSWKTRLTVKPSVPYFDIQAYRPEWPSTIAGIHYEARVTDEFLRRGIIDLNLHIEDDTPKQDAICSRIRELLRPHERQLLATCGTRLSEESMDEILKGELPLTSLTSKGLVEAIERMSMTESFVDEALYLAGKELVYRTDFRGTVGRPGIDFNGKTGGWEFRSREGRFNSPSLKCRGDAFNWFDSEDTSILVLHPLNGFQDFANGERVYISATVRAPQGGQLQLVAQACAKKNWINIFDETPQLPETDLWQFTTAEGKLDAPKGYDFTKDGLFPYIMVTAPKKEIWFDSIEIGRCG